MGGIACFLACWLAHAGHIVDSTSFPYCSEMFPGLCEKGAYSARATYTKAQLKSLVDYAESRGVRIMPEFVSGSRPAVYQHLTTRSFWVVERAEWLAGWGFTLCCCRLVLRRTCPGTATGSRASQRSW
eukprot:COSAG06_NODE_263_length_18879_cov_71.911555_11_plen_128_part_00